MVFSKQKFALFLTAPLQAPESASYPASPEWGVVREVVSGDEIRSGTAPMKNGIHARIEVAEGIDSR